MSPKEAYDILKDKVGTRKIITCFDYGKYFLFGTIPFNYKPVTDDGKTNIPFDSSYVVDKNTKAVNIFNPMRINIGTKYEIIEDFR